MVPTSMKFLKCWIPKYTNYDSEKQRHLNAMQVLAEHAQSLLLYVLDPVKERTLGQHMKPSSNYYQINAVKKRTHCQVLHAAKPQVN